MEPTEHFAFDPDDPPPETAWDFYDFFNRAGENFLRWLRLWRVL